jgi:hypothetical protein
MPSVRGFPWVVIVAGFIAFGTACRGHPQREGDYAFTPTEVITDGCGLLGSPDALGGGTLILTGNELAMAIDLFDVQLVGRYLESVERFTLDGSVGGQALTVQGQPCVADLVTVHIDATTVSPDEFTGAIQIRVEGPTPQCTCTSSTSFSAMHR